MENILALDIGRKKIGVAAGSSDTRFAFPRPPLLIDSVVEGLEGIAALVREGNISKIVAGLPLSTDGTDSEQTTFTRDFLQQLEAHVRLPIIVVEERFSTQGVVKQQIGRPLEKGEEDSLVAQALLSSYFQSL